MPAILFGTFRILDSTALQQQQCFTDYSSHKSHQNSRHGTKRLHVSNVLSSGSAQPPDVCMITQPSKLFFSHLFSPASGQALVTGVVASPPRLCRHILCAKGAAIPLLVDFSSRVAHSHSRIYNFRQSISARVNKVPTNSYKYALEEF